MCRDRAAKYARPGQKPRYCGPCCVGKNMVNVVNKKCPCGTIPSYGFSGGKAVCCKECKEPGMIDVVNKKCPCGKIASYGVSGGKAECCKDCKKPDMVDVVNKKCPCGKQPSYGVSGGKAVCCKECKKPGMVDVKNPKCPCGNQMSFGFPGGKAECCKECKKPDMVDVKNPKCPCGTRPSYGVPGGIAECCIECKEPDMVDVVNKMCPGYDGVPCPVITQLTYGREYCLACDPDESRRTARFKDERAFFDFLAENDVSVTQRSYRIDYRCIDTSRKYSLIDGVIIAADVVVCIELDEDAHENYDPTCEEARMNDASAELKIAFPDRPIEWIRVNPHIKKDGKRDVSRAAKKVRDERHREALVLIRDVLENPRGLIEYVGY